MQLKINNTEISENTIYFIYRFQILEGCDDAFSSEKFINELNDGDEAWIKDEMNADEIIPFEELSLFDGFELTKVKKLGGDRDFEPTFTTFKLKRGNERLKFQVKMNHAIGRNSFYVLSSEYKVK